MIFKCKKTPNDLWDITEKKMVQNVARDKHPEAITWLEPACIATAADIDIYCSFNRTFIVAPKGTPRWLAEIRSMVWPKPVHNFVLYLVVLWLHYQF